MISSHSNPGALDATIRAENQAHPELRPVANASGVNPDADLLGSGPATGAGAPTAAASDSRAVSGVALARRADSFNTIVATVGLALLLSIPLIGMVIGMFMVCGKAAAILVVSRHRLSDLAILFGAALAAMVGMVAVMWTFETHFAFMAWLAGFAFNAALIRFVWLGLLGHATTRLG